MNLLRGLASVVLVAAVAAAQSPGQGGLVGSDGTSFPLERTEVDARVSGAVADVTVRQIFSNPFEEAIEAVYVFPLPDRSAIHEFSLEVGRYRIRGEIRRRAEAEATYERAKQEGKTAALLTQERPNIFTQRVANLLPGERIVVELSYLEDLVSEGGVRRFVFPTVVGPRYHPPGGVPDADRIPSRSRDYLPPDTRSGHDLSLAVRIDAGLPIAGLASTSHRVDVAHDGGPVAVVRLHPEDRIPNKDFQLTWTVAGAQPRVALHTHRADKGGFFALSIQPEADPDEAIVPSRELVFVLDCSGSMSGKPIATAKAVVDATLNTMRPDDTFQILRFSEQASGLWKEPRPATPANVAEARRYVSRLSGGGGTRMLTGIRTALAPRHDPRRLRIVHFLTDGYIGNETEILAEMARHLGNARIFPLGVGSSVNRYLIDRMARAGRGAAAYIRQDAPPMRVAREVDRFVERVRRPTLLDLAIDWDGLPVQEIFPTELPDLFAGQPIFVHGRYTGTATGEVVVRGMRSGKPYEQRVSVELPEREVDHAALERLWARAAILEMMSRQAEAGSEALERWITDLALEFSLMTNYTAFVAVEEHVVVVDGETRTVRQRLLQPEGTRAEGLFGPVPPPSGPGTPAGPTSPSMPSGSGPGGSFRGPSGGVPAGLRTMGDPDHLDQATLKDDMMFWKPEGKVLGEVGATSLGALELLAREKPTATVDRAIAWLSSHMSLKGAIVSGRTTALDQALAAAALVEDAARKKRGGRRERDRARRALRHLLSIQREDGGWGRGDALTTSFALLALERARKDGLGVKSDAALAKGAAHLDSLTEPTTGKVGMLARPAANAPVDPLAQAATALARLALGKTDAGRVGAALLTSNAFPRIDPMAHFLRACVLRRSLFASWRVFALPLEGARGDWGKTESAILRDLALALGTDRPRLFALR